MQQPVLSACEEVAGPWRGDPAMFVGDCFNPIEGSAFARLREERGIATGPGGDMLLRGVIEALLDIAPQHGEGDEVLA